MKKQLLFLSVLLLNFIGCYSQNLEWATYYGGMGKETVTSLKVIENGGLLTAGTYLGTIDFDTLSLPCTSTGCSYLTLINNEGKAERITKSEFANFYDCIKTKNGETVVCGSAKGKQILGISQPDFKENTTFVALLGKDNNVKWIIRCGTPSYFDDAFKLLELSNGNVLIGFGYFKEYFLPNGDTLKTNNGRNIGFGIFEININDGDIIRSKRLGVTGSTYQIKSLDEDDDGNIYVAGLIGFQTALFNDSLVDFGASSYLLKMDNSFNKEFIKFFESQESNGYVELNDMKMDKDGNSYCIGTFYQTNLKVGNKELTNYGKRDIFITKIDNSGNVVWAKRAGGGNDDKGVALALDDSDNVYITGTHWNFSEIGDTVFKSVNSTADIFFAKMTTDGEFKWAYSYGSRTDETAFDIAVSGSDLYLTGRFCEILGGTGTSKMDFGGFSLNSIGQNGNIYLAKFDLSKLPTSNNNLKQFTQKGLSLYPNPANNLLYIDGFITGQELDYHIYQTNGKLAQSGSATNQIDISFLPKGMYLLKVNNGAQQFQARFVKE